MGTASGVQADHIGFIGGNAGGIGIPYIFVVENIQHGYSAVNMDLPL